MAGLSQVKAAERAGMSRTALAKHINAGRIALLADRTIDPVSFEAWLQGRGATASSGLQPATLSDSSVDSQTAENARAALALVDQDGVFATRADAERFRDSFIGRLRQVEYDREARRVADIADTARLVGEEYAKVRTRLLAIPAERAPQLHRCKTVAEVQEMLRDIITRALEELTLDAGPAGSE